jgi:hypothetical protein
VREDGRIKCEEREKTNKMQQLDVYYQLLSQHARSQEPKDGRIVGGEGWQEKVHNREEWKEHLRTAKNHCILRMPME